MGDCKAPKNTTRQRTLRKLDVFVFQVHKVPYKYLKRITQDFAAKDAKAFVGRGGFAEVYLGVTER